jgi:hypothetical protein
MAEKTSPRFGVRLSTMLLLVALLGVLTWGVRQSLELRRARQELAAARSRAEAARVEALEVNRFLHQALTEEARARRDAGDRDAER